MIIHFDVSDDSIVASLPEANHNRTFAYANTGEHRKVGGLVVRTIPVFVTTTGRDNTVSYHPFPEWEWALWFVFAPKLRSGTSGEVFNHLNPLDGSFQYKGESQKYVAAGLVSLLPENEVFLFPDGVQQITYGQATNALASLIQVETSIRDAARVANGQEARLNA